MFCQNCGKEIDDRAVMCPYCKKEITAKPKNGDGKNISIGCLTLIFILVLMAVFTSIMDEGSDDSTNTQVVKSKPKLEVLNSYNCSLSEFGGSAICGTVINNTDKTYGYAQIEINLYDKSGAQIGSTMDNINNLAPHTKWNFKAVVIEDGVASYKIVETSGF